MLPRTLPWLLLLLQRQLLRSVFMYTLLMLPC
jgi:hypothetical protein